MLIWYVRYADITSVVDRSGGKGSFSGSIFEADLYFVTLTLTVSVVFLGTPQSATSGRCQRIKNDLRLRWC